ncbi:MAG TPA: glycosyltransferase [Thermoanaerobaculia bacterium]|jgi:glycosyltransferase involved in cell wall biosynthesis
MKFSIVTPCRNAESLIADTVRSVVNQSAVVSGRAELDYAIYDGASTDGTLAVIRGMVAPNVSVRSAPDGGMYDALARGLQDADGDWVGYVNAGDMLSERAFDTILDVAEQHDVQWVTGIGSRYSERGAVTYFSLPFRYRRSLIMAGQYTRRSPFFLPWIQQESTFWRGSLLRLVDFERLRTFRQSGDAYLWSCFAREADLHIVAAQLGGFRHHPAQLSDAKRNYKREVAQFAPPPRLRDGIWALTDNILWFAPWRLKKMFNRRLMLQYDFGSGRWI